jgi:hypothetical protein
MTCASKLIEGAVRMDAEADSTEELRRQGYVLPVQENQPSLTDCLGFCIIHSRYSIWLAILCVLLAMMLTGYSFVSDRYACVPTMGASPEDPEAIIVSGTISQQRDAVLSNFAKYGNRTGESVSRVR